MLNLNPQPGEGASVVNHWKESAHETFATISYPSYPQNLGGKGHLLLLPGLDVAGTQAAADILFRDDVLVPILKQATRPDGSLRFFEVLLRSTSIESSAAETWVIVTRIYWVPRKTGSRGSILNLVGFFHPSAEGGLGLFTHDLNRGNAALLRRVV